MGLSVNYVGDIPYKGFNEFRRALIDAAGMPVPEYDKYKWYHYLGTWKAMPKDPLTILIVHADNEGFIFPDHMLPILDRLREIRPNMDPEWVDYLDQWIEGLVAADERIDVIQFC